MDESVIQFFEQAQVAKPKLSAAIREGAKLRPQAFGTCRGDRNDQSCAIMAAAEAVGINYAETEHTEDAWEFLRERGIVRSAFDANPLSAAIIHRQDTLGWTREKVADWLESQGL